MRLRLSMTKRGMMRLIFGAILILLSISAICALIIANNEKKYATTRILEELQRIEMVYKEKIDTAEQLLHKIANSKEIRKIYTTDTSNLNEIEKYLIIAGIDNFKDIILLGPKSEIIYSFRHKYPPASLKEDINNIKKEKGKGLVVYSPLYPFWKGYHIFLGSDIIIGTKKKGEIWGVIPIENIPIVESWRGSFLAINDKIVFSTKISASDEREIMRIISGEKGYGIIEHKLKQGNRYIIKASPPYGIVVGIEKPADTIARALYSLFFLLFALTIGLLLSFMIFDRNYIELANFEKWLTSLKSKPITIEDLERFPASTGLFSHLGATLTESFKLYTARTQELQQNLAHISKRIITRIQSLKENLEIIFEALLEPTKNSANIASSITEMGSDSKELVESTKLAVDVTRDSEKNLLVQSKIWRKSSSLVELAISRVQELRSDLDNLSQYLVSTATIVKTLEDKMWTIFTTETQKPLPIANKNINLQGIFKSLADLIAFIDSTDNLLTKLKAKSESAEGNLKELSEKIKEAILYIENFLTTEKRLLSLLEKLISVADGSIWSVEDIKHNIENVSRVNWDIASQIKSILNELDDIQKELEISIREGVIREEKKAA